MPASPPDPATTIALDVPQRPDVRALLEEHLADMYSTSPAESVHALDPDALTAPGLTFWTMRSGGPVGVLLGCVALKELDARHGELKSMRTATAARGRGHGAALLAHVIEVARARGYRRVSLETGTQDYFAPARALYESRGFTPCGPFGDYAPDPASAFFTLTWVAQPPPRAR